MGVDQVMDDNRMLTLASNERIPLKSYMRMIFEIRDLKYATPATVSRAGILYISTVRRNYAYVDRCVHSGYGSAAAHMVNRILYYVWRVC